MPTGCGNDELPLESLCVYSSRGVELDAAEPVFGFEAGIEPGLADVVDCCLQEAEVHAADEFRVLLCESVERAVPQDDSAVGAGLGFEAVFCKHIKQSTTTRPDAPPGGAPQPNADLPGKSKARRVRDVVDGRRDVDTFGFRPVGRIGQHPGDELVVTRWQGNLEVSAGSTVELGGATRAWSSTAGQPLVVDLQEAICGEAIEMVGDRAPLETDGFGSLIAADPLAGLDDDVVDRPAGGFCQRGDRTQAIGPRR